MKPSSIFRSALLRWQLRQLFFINAFAVATAALYTLFRREPMLAPGELTMLLAVIAHSGAVVWKLGRVSSRQTGFLHAQGFSRDQIWWQTLFASMLSALLVCGTVWFLMVTGMRSTILDRWFASPYFPFMATAEFSLPAVVLFEYAAVLPLMHYVWIRANQPAKSAASGWFLMCLGLCFYVWAFELAGTHVRDPSFLRILPAMFVPAIVLLLITCWRLHRTMEVRS